MRCAESLIARFLPASELLRDWQDQPGLGTRAHSEPSAEILKATVALYAFDDRIQVERLPASILLSVDASNCPGIQQM